jgi:hypothetical protein
MANGNTNPGSAPSGSTNATLVGGSLAVITLAILHAKGITLGPDVEPALAVVFASIAGYIPRSGRSRPPTARTRSTDQEENPK